MSLPIAIQLYSLRNEMESDFEGTLKHVRDLGFDGVELAGFHGKDPKDVKKMLDDLNLKAISAHVSLEEMMADAEGVFSIYASLGCEYIAVPFLLEERRPNMPLFEDTIQQLALLGAKAKEHGLQLLYHNHDFEFEKVGDVYGLDYMYSSVAADLLQTQLDTCWVKVAGLDPAEYILKYKDRAPVVHLKDFYLEPSAGQVKLYELMGIASNQDEKPEKEVFGFRPLGMGMQDMHAILQSCNKAGTKWVVYEQDLPQPGRTALECARLSIKYLKNLKW